MDKYNKNEGFTLIEILVVIGILAIIASFGLFFSMENYRGSSFRDERDLLVSTLQHSRAQAVNNVCFGSPCPDGKPHGIHFFPKGDPSDDRFVVFQGASFHDTADDALVDEVIKFDNRAVYIDTSLPVDIIFDRLSGNSDDKSIILKDDAGHTSTVDINQAGRIDWTN